jgi:hypothetical protein
MKPFHSLECDTLSLIQTQVMRLIKNNRADLLTSERLWNKINTVDLLRSSPALIEYCNTLGLKIREVALTVVHKCVDTSLHIDELPVTAKMNIPIQNTRYSFNRWYNLPKQMLNSANVSTNEFGKKYYSFTNVDYSKIQMIAELELLCPVIFNSQIAHNIIIGKDCQLPRVVMACTFFNEPIGYLQE